MSIFDKECPRDPRDAYREGERSRWIDRNPYEHGKWGDYECRRAYEEWDRGREDHMREERQEEERQREAQERAYYERQQAAQQDEERLYYEALEAQQMQYSEEDIRETERLQPPAAQGSGPQEK